MKYDFTELAWMQRQHRGKSFPFHGKAKIILQDGDQVTFNTGNTEMYDVRFSTGLMHRIFGHNVSVTLTDSDGNEYRCSKGMYMTRNNADPHRGNAGRSKWGEKAHDQLPFNATVTLTVSGDRPVKVVYTGANLVK